MSVCHSCLPQGSALLDTTVQCLLGVANISLSCFPANLRFTTDTVFFNYIFLFILADEDDRHTNDSIESETDSDDCIVTSPISKNIIQVSWSVLWWSAKSKKKKKVKPDYISSTGMASPWIMCAVLDSIIYI